MGMVNPFEIKESTKLYTIDEVIDLLTYSKLDNRYTMDWWKKQSYWEYERIITIELLKDYL